MRKRRGYTLIEMLVVLFLVVLVYSLVGATTVQVGRYSRSGVEAARARVELIRVAELMRWQLRSLYESPDSKVKPLEGVRTGQEGRDSLLFTARPEKGQGVVEVGYQILTALPDEKELDENRDGPTDEGAPGEKQPFLAYREFPYPDGEGLRDRGDHVEAHWRLLSEEVAAMDVEYSLDGALWQQEWDDSAAPRNVRVALRTQDGTSLTFVVSPGVKAPRW